MVKGSDDCAPVEVDYILTLADNNGMTVLYETKEMIVWEKTRRASPLVVSDIHQET